MDELEVLRIRDEVLQAMYWMRSEGLGDRPAPAELSRFLAVPPAVLDAYLERFIADGLLEADGGGVRLTDSGTQAGRRAFADEFADFTRPTHGECDEDCWCHDSPEEAARCHETRGDHAHTH